MSDIRLRADGAAHRGCSGSTEDAKPMDRAALEEAIKDAADWNYGAWDNRRAMVIDAARAYLATLPVKKWGVSVGGVGWVHFDTLPEAMCAVKDEARAGRAVTIEYRVPA